MHDGDWLEDILNGNLKGIDSLGRLRLDYNNGTPVPIDQIPQGEIDHTHLVNVGTHSHAQIDAFIESHTHKSKALLLFGYSNMILLGPGESQILDARTVDGAANTLGYRMMRAGTVTGVSLQCLCTEDAGIGSIQATVQKNGVNQSMTVSVDDAAGAIGDYSTANSFDFAAGDQINIELYAVENDYIGDLQFSNIAVVVEIEFASQVPT